MNVATLVLALVTLLAGVLIGWLLARSRPDAGAGREQRLRDAFGAAAGEALQRNGQAFAAPPDLAYREPAGSNGIVIAPKDTANGHALLLINPHTSFFFRSELQMTSDEGLNAYGAVTWGQFFIYQGFNAHQGWMHTSSGVDVVDEFS